MGCPSECELEKTLTFSVTTHSPETGAVSDADTVPAYRIYEDETGTAVLTGSMAKLDDANTTGFYSELITCAAASGFEADKTYTILVSAAVGGVTGSISFGVKVLANIWSYDTRTLTQTGSSVVSAVSGDALTIHRGDTLSVTFSGLSDNSSYTKLWFTVKVNLTDADTSSIIQIVLTNPGDAGDGLLYLNAAAATAGNGAITVPSSTSVAVTLAAVETAKLIPGSYMSYDVQMETSSGITTLVAGTAAVTGDVSRATS